MAETADIQPLPKSDIPSDNSESQPSEVLSARPLSETEVQQLVGRLTINATQLALTNTTQFALTVPPPEIIEGYLKFYPDAAKKFFQWAEDESTHRREMDTRLVNSRVEDSRRGMNYGLAVSFAGLALAGFATWMHEPWVAGVVGGGTLVALARAFIVGKNLILRGPKRKTSDKN